MTKPKLTTSAWHKLLAVGMDQMLALGIRVISASALWEHIYKHPPPPGDIQKVKKAFPAVIVKLRHMHEKEFGYEQPSHAVKFEWTVKAKGRTETWDERPPETVKEAMPLLPLGRGHQTYAVRFPKEGKSDLCWQIMHGHSGASATGRGKNHNKRTVLGKENKLMTLPAARKQYIGDITGCVPDNIGKLGLNGVTVNTLNKNNNES